MVQNPPCYATVVNHIEKKINYSNKFTCDSNMCANVTNLAITHKFLLQLSLWKENTFIATASLLLLLWFLNKV